MKGEKDIINSLSHIQGMARGVIFQTDAKFIRLTKGENGLQMVMSVAEKMGFEIDYNKIISTKWYPIKLRLISLFSVRKAFNWDDEQIKKMGQTAPKYSLMTKMMLSNDKNDVKIFHFD
jgi:hypothetical protein